MHSARLLSRLLPCALLAAGLQGLPAAQPLAQTQARPQAQPRPAPARPPSQPPRPGSVQREPLATPPPPVSRHLTVAELGLAGGALFDPGGRMLLFPLPPGPAAPLRLTFQVELIAPFPGRFAVELTANGRVVGALPFPADRTRLGFEATIAAEDVARGPGGLEIGLRLLAPEGSNARANLLPTSHLAVPLPAAPISLPAFAALLPTRVVLLAPPEGFTHAASEAALQLGLALQARGHQVTLGEGPPTTPMVNPTSRAWELAAILLGIPTPGLGLVTLGEAPVMAVGEGGVAAALAALRPPPAPAALPTGLPLGRLAPLPALEGPRLGWRIPFDLATLPRGTWPSSIEARLLTTPGSEGPGRLMLNGEMLATARPDTEGRIILSAPVPPRLPLARNQIDLLLEGSTGTAQPDPDSLLRLAAPPPPQRFVELAPRFAGGIEVLAEAPVAAASLQAALWTLRDLVAPGAPVRVSDTPTAPTGPWLAVGPTPPPGVTPRLTVTDGVVRADGGAPLASLTHGWLAQLLPHASAPGLWLQPVGQGAALPFGLSGPQLGDAALLDERGVAQTLVTLPANVPPLPVPEAARPAIPAPAPPPALPAAAEARPGFDWLILRPFVGIAAWLAFAALLAYAFIFPRREWKR